MRGYKRTTTTVIFRRWRRGHEKGVFAILPEQRLPDDRCVCYQPTDLMTNALGLYYFHYHDVIRRSMPVRFQEYRLFRKQLTAAIGRLYAIKPYRPLRPLYKACFRKWRLSHGRGMIALLPEFAESPDGRLCRCYTEALEVGAIDYAETIKQTRPVLIKDSQSFADAIARKFKIRLETVVRINWRANWKRRGLTRGFRGRDYSGAFRRKNTDNYVETTLERERSRR